MSKAKKILYVIAGVLAFVLGGIGIVVPGIPTTPFWLLSLWCFSNSLVQVHEVLSQNVIVKRYINRQGVSMKSKMIYIATMVLMVSFSVRFYWQYKPIVVLLIGVSAVGLLFMIKYIKVIKK